MSSLLGAVWKAPVVLLAMVEPAAGSAPPSGTAIAAQAATSSAGSSGAADAVGAAALQTDVERIVTNSEAAGWFVDDVAYREIYAVLLESVCRANESARRGALELARADAQRAGDPRRIFEDDGRRITDRFEEALTRDRILQALTRSLDGAARDCPFWEVPRDGFRSRQTDYRTFGIAIETGGNIQLRQTAGRWTFGGGGLGRILPSYGLTEHLTLMAGIEFGGGAMLRPGSPQTEFVVNYFPAIPIVLRLRDVNWRYDLEVGAVGLFQADNTDLSYGARIGTAISLLGLRTRNVLPWAGIAGTYEYYFESGGRPRAHFLRGGLRVGILWDI